MKKSLPSAVHVSGGVGYHWRAHFYKQKLWSSFKINVTRWLSAWCADLVSKEDLIIIGPSAGYTLPSDFLQRFNRLHLLEPDPLARWLWPLQRGPAPSLRPNVEWLPQINIFSLDQSGEFSELTKLLQRLPKAAVLMSNLLGQLQWIFPELIEASAHGQSLRQKFLKSLDDRHWASYHDLASMRGSFPRGNWSHPQGLQSFSEIWPDPHQDFELVDHGTLWLSEQRQTELAVWKLTPANEHLVAFVTN